MDNFIYGIIYKAVLKINSKVYIGQTVKHLKKRIAEHKFGSKNPKNNHFYKAINKYGIENFEWTIEKECFSKEELDNEEIKYIELYDSKNPKKGFNLKSGGSYGEHSEETKKIISDGKLGDKNPMFGKPSWNKNKKLSELHIENLSKSHKGQTPWNKGKKYKTNTSKTDEAKQKISKANKGENNGMAKFTWEIIRQMRDLYDNGYSRKELSEKFNISIDYLSAVLNNKVWRE